MYSKQARNERSAASELKLARICEHKLGSTRSSGGSNELIEVVAVLDARAIEADKNVAYPNASQVSVFVLLHQLASTFVPGKQVSTCSHVALPPHQPPALHCPDHHACRAAPVTHVGDLHPQRALRYTTSMN